MIKKQQIERKAIVSDIIRRFENSPALGVLGARQVGNTSNFAGG